MVRHRPTPVELRDLISRIDKVGYESILFVYGQYVPDTATLVANALQNDQKVKLMFATRPHAVTPMHLANVVSAYEKIAPGRYVFNLVAGTAENEHLFESSATPDERKKYAAEFIQKVKEYVTCQNFPTVAFSGSSDITIDNVINHGDIIVLHMADYLRNIDRLKNIKQRKMIRAWILVKETDEAAEKELEEYLEEDKEREQVIRGSAETVMNRLDELEEIGVTDILISHFKSSSEEEVHDFVTKYLNRG
jgi:alkanesulfonate monooxygenase SsuD/methylene tetrahydromethanopterin reductase-like flavin-dependent oxidoreductase (luciferase family)